MAIADRLLFFPLPLPAAQQSDNLLFFPPLPVAQQSDGIMWPRRWTVNIANNAVGTAP